MSNLINIETIDKDFYNWIKDRIKQYGFVEGDDFIIVENLSSSKLVSSKSRPQKLKEYHIALNMAKKLSMVERNEKGKQARQYFIECEKRVLQP
ncbi:MAG TPA: antA/AntB antirepressor family protein [Arsenophonus sp.]